MGLEEQLEEYVDDASAEEGETGGSKLAPPPAITCHQSGAVKGNQEEQVGGEQVDAQLVDQLHQAYRLGGHRAAAIALWWLEEGSNNGVHFDLAGLTFQALPSEVKERFLWRAILITHPLTEEER